MTNHASRLATDDAAFLAVAGPAGRCAQAVDWDRTPLGPVATWPQSLRTIVGIVLRSRHPMFLWWGPELVQFYNDAYLPSFGFGKHPQAMGQRGSDCWQEIWPLIRPQIDDVMLRGKPSWNEDQLVPVLRNGGLEDVYWTYGYSPVLLEGGGVGGTLVVCTETTARVVAERRLRVARLLSERTSAVAADIETLVRLGARVIVEVAGEGDVPFALTYLFDAGALRLVDAFGLTEQELLLLAPTVHEQLVRPGRTAGVLSLPALARRNTAEKAFFAVLTEAGREGPIGFVVFGLTSRLPFGPAYQAHLQELADVLCLNCSRVAMRVTQHQAEQALTLTSRMASVGTLAAGVAHEINNPLTTVMANLDLVLDDLRAVGEDTRVPNVRELEQMLVEARAGGERVQKIVRGLKTFSRASEERVSLTELEPVLELSIQLASGELRQRARLVKHYGVTPRVSVDVARLGQVFINILVNAVQAMPTARGDTGEIRIATSTDTAGRAVIEFQDSGAGIPASVLPRVFDPFFTTKTTGNATGLGLSVCHNVVTGLGGTITVESQEGHGAAVRVVLPPAASDRDRPRPNSVVPPPANAPRRGCVLIVDDERAVGVALGRVLREHEVTIMTSAKEALALIITGLEFDVILSDLMMPGMSGMDLHADLLSRFPIAAARMVFVTGGAFTVEANSFLDRVPNQRIDKPIDVPHIRTLVGKLVARTSSPRH